MKRIFDTETWHCWTGSHRVKREHNMGFWKIILIPYASLELRYKEGWNGWCLSLEIVWLTMYAHINLSHGKKEETKYQEL